MEKLDQENETRAQRGARTFARITGAPGQQLLQSIGELSPDLASYTVEFPFGDLVSRPGLSLRDREMCTVSALIALGFALPQLKLHMNGALNVGVKREELVELVMQMAAYCGFPACLNAVLVAKEIFTERDRDATSA